MEVDKGNGVEHHDVHNAGEVRPFIENLELERR